ncbi:BAG domain-containing protein Samui isoform X2 [Venturia canescens]|uniref:BAG domain-containing protein Samui isoform X2 n=1 Tax=Venturia canescens TaxID=32260 RepID=UPI001C9D027F|nr:BAG domain-containing protein Samui isoform X2 [Venturia canescens]
MDSPVVVDHASEFGRGIDLDRVFPGFPFDDAEGFGRRSSDIRSHLDDLASRHPEFADHLLGSAWGDIPAFRNTGSLRNRRRRDSGGSSTYQGQPDEDARSQTSGSSGTSAASGASGVSSHGEPSNSPSNVHSKESQGESVPRESVDTHGTRRNPIPQYGLRNTVDIGQHRHEMENDERMNDNNRGQRSMSAPPENRQQNESGIKQSEQPQNPNQRFVSRVDITPQFGQPISSNEKSASKAPQQQQTSTPQQKPQQQSNVRHIPIFVEGRDEPVVPKNIDHDQNDGPGWTYAKPPRTESPPHFQHNPQFTTPPQFHRPSHFNQHYTGGRARDWLPNFEEEFYSPQGFQQPGFRRHQQQPFTSQSPPRQQGPYRQPQTEPRPSSQRPHNEGPYYKQQTHSAPQQQPQHHQAPPRQQQQQQQQQHPEPAPEQPRKQKQPKDPLEKVAEVQKEVDSLNEQVIQWNGKSRKDKQYIYLDEMLTRELIKLDDIETEGKDNVRQARKQAIKSIQDSISLLESKAPLNDQAPATENKMEIQQETPEASNATPENAEPAIVNDENVAKSENTGNDEEQQQQQRQSDPLPAAPSSPTKEPLSASLVVEATTTASENESSTCDQASQRDNVVMEVAAAPVAKVSSVGSMEIQTNAETEQPATGSGTPPVNQPETTVMEVETPKSPNTAKKSKKTKKQQQLKQQQAPISDGAIPLPAPESHDTNATK